MGECEPTMEECESTMGECDPTMGECEPTIGECEPTYSFRRTEEGSDSYKVQRLIQNILSKHGIQVDHQSS